MSEGTWWSAGAIEVSQMAKQIKDNSDRISQ